MSIVEVEVWRIAEGAHGDEHDAMIRKWFSFVKERQVELFPEWKSVRYYRELDTTERTPTGRYIMLFEFHTLEGRDAYKARRHDWSGPYAEYREVDPYQFFDHSSVTLDFWEPREEQLWMEFN